MGILFAFIAMFSWGLGDFLIQKSARKFGDWLTLFYIAAFSAIVLFPFVCKELPGVFSDIKTLAFLILAGIVILFAALFDIEAFKRGKISIIEPVNAMELPIAVLLASLILGEYLNFSQWLLLVLLIGGIFLVSTKSFRHLKNIRAERGVGFAALAAIAMGTTCLLFGVGGRKISPLMINWFTDLFLAIITFGYLAYKSRLREIAIDFRQNKKLILGVSFFDNAAWIAYTYSMVYIPIAISTGISESYIALAALLGLTINKEKLKKHQWLGLAVCIFAAVALAFLTGT